MSDNSIYYMIKPGDSLENISKKTGIPLNSLLSMKSDTFTNVNHLNLGDQIVWKDGIATYENHLYGPLSQKPQPKPISNNIINEELVTDDVPISKSSTGMENATSEQNPVSSNNGSNSPTKSCEVCGTDTCLCEVEIIDNKQNTNHILKGKSALSKAGNERLSNLMLFYKELDIDYRVRGECVNNNKDKGCVSVYIKEYSGLVPNATELLERSRRSKSFGPSYNRLIEPIVENSDIYHETSQKCEKHIKYTQKYDSKEKEVLVSTDGKKVSDLMKTSKVVDMVAFMRGLNFLIGGNLQAFPANIYRFGVLTCTKDNKVITEHYTDFVVLPSYSVSYKGSLSFKKEYAATSKTETGSLSLTFTEKVDNKTENSITYTYKKIREEHAKSLSDALPKEEGKDNTKGNKNKAVEAVKGVGNKFLDNLFKLGNFIDEYSKKPKEILDSADNNLNNKTGFDASKILYADKRPKLFTIGLSTPKLTFGTEASLRFTGGNVLDIDRSRKKPENEQKIEDPEKPLSPNGTINTPSVIDIPNREADETKKKQKVDQYNKSYLRFEPLIRGVCAINLIQVLGLLPIPPLQALIKGLAFADIDIFSQLSEDELVWDKGEGARQTKLEKSNGKALRVQVFAFCSFDLDFSPLIMLHDEKPDKFGMSVEVLGSFGSGFALGAAGEVDVIVIKIKGAIQGSYGIRFYFSLDILTGVVKIWHDGIGGDASVQRSAKMEGKGTGKKRNYGGSVSHKGVTIDQNSMQILSSSSTQGVTDIDWRDTSYKPGIDEPYDSPTIIVPAVYNDSIWGLTPDKTRTVHLPNPVSRFVGKEGLKTKEEWMDTFLQANQGDRKRAEAIYKGYENEIKQLERQKTKHETGYWFPPTSSTKPSYSFNIYNPPENESK